jgi:hypothetical protein
MEFMHDFLLAASGIVTGMAFVLVYQRIRYGKLRDKLIKWPESGNRFEVWFETEKERRRVLTTSSAARARDQLVNGAAPLGVEVVLYDRGKERGRRNA